jgi:hypothetical protein
LPIVLTEKITLGTLQLEHADNQEQNELRARIAEARSEARAAGKLFLKQAASGLAGMRDIPRTLIGAQPAKAFRRLLYYAYPRNCC